MESTKFRLVSASLRRDLIGDLGPVHAPPEEFVNAALFLRLGLTSTLIRHEIAALFLRLGLPSTLIRHEKRAFRKRSSNPRSLKKLALRFIVDGTHFEKGDFPKRWHRDNDVISLTEFSLTTTLKWPVIVAFSNFSGVVWTGNIWCIFRVKESLIFKFIPCIAGGAFSERNRLLPRGFMFSLPTVRHYSLRSDFMLIVKVMWPHRACFCWLTLASYKAQSPVHTASNCLTSLNITKIQIILNIFCLWKPNLKSILFASPYSFFCQFPKSTAPPLEVAPSPMLHRFYGTHYCWLLDLVAILLFLK